MIRTSTADSIAPARTQGRAGARSRSREEIVALIDAVAQALHDHDRQGMPTWQQTKERCASLRLSFDGREATKQYRARAVVAIKAYLDWDDRILGQLNAASGM